MTGTGECPISFAAREPRNTRASGPLVDDPTSKSSVGSQSMLDIASLQAAPVPTKRSTPASTTPSLTSSSWGGGDLFAPGGQHRVLRREADLRRIHLAPRMPKLATRSDAPVRSAICPARATTRSDASLSE